MQQALGDALFSANFGRKSLEGSSLLVASHYRFTVAVLIVMVLFLHIPMVALPQLLLLTIVLYLVYVLIRFLVLTRLEQRFYHQTVQIWRAILCIVGLTGILLFVATYNSIGTLWILYLPALLMASRYCRRQRPYFLLTLGVITAIITISWVETVANTRDAASAQAKSTLFIQLADTRVAALVLASFLLHYLARVTVIARRGTIAREQVFYHLLEHVMLNTHGKNLWVAIRTACAQAVNANMSEIYIYNRKTTSLYQVDADNPLCLQVVMPTSSTHIAARAIRARDFIENTHPNGVVELAAPIFGMPNREGHPLAVIVLRFTAGATNDRRSARDFLRHILDNIWSVCAYAGLRQEWPIIGEQSDGDIHRLRLMDVVDVALDSICGPLSFSFATISIVDEDQQEIRTVKGKNVPDDWVADAHHPLDSHDIQADVLRNGRAVIIDRWDERFDTAIWQKYNHADLVRIWVPLGRLGTIEAGFSKRDRTIIPSALVDMLTSYASELRIAIENAQSYEREQRHARILEQLHGISHRLQTHTGQYHERSLLKDVAEGALSALGADIVLFYPLDRESQLLTTPISAGHIFDESHPLSLPNERTNIVQHVAAAMQPYYEADVHKDTLFIGARRVGAPTRSFAARQRVHSFAGIPLIARGTLHGILCVNYRTRHEFSPSKRQVIELYAQMTATVIANGQYTREQERRRLEYDLHDAVKSSLRGLILLSHAATNALDLNVQSARRHLHDVRRAAWGILADLDMILHDLALTSRDRSALHNYIRNDIGRMVGQNWDRVIVEIAPNLPALPTHTARAMLFILREAFMNAVEHASAQHIQVQVHYVNGHIHIVVADDGCGFDSSVKQDTIHRGLTSIYERVQTAGGSVELTTAEGHGTHLFIQLPGKEYADDQH